MKTNCDRCKVAIDYKGDYDERWLCAACQKTESEINDAIKKMARGSVMSENQAKSRLMPPVRQHINLDNDVACLHFLPGSVAPDGDYWVRGSVCWPERTDRGVLGFALLGGLHIPSQVLYLFEQHEFSVIDPWVEDGSLQPWPALAPFINRCWSLYYCRTYYWQGDMLTRREFLRQIAVSDLIQPKPVFPEVRWDDDGAALSAIALWGSRRKLVQTEGDGESMSVVKAVKANQVKPAEIMPPLRALMALVAGMAKRPYWAQGVKHEE